MGELSDEFDKLESNKKNKLSKTADDVLERKEEADTEQSKRYDDKHHHKLQVREPKGKKERIDREGREEHTVDTYKSNEGSLSTRYCPEHTGVQWMRIGPSTVQCPYDGAVFNFETGYTTFDGKQVPGGSVAGQTPDSSGYGIPHRVFDSRENVLNRVS